MTQLPLPLMAPEALDRFRIFHHGQRVSYGDVSRHMRMLKRSGRWAELDELVEVAAEVFSAPEWRRMLAAWKAGNNSGVKRSPWREDEVGA
ncbi:hypothetical protein HI806_02285 [Ralstonia solanacearum]|nr:hypothetical protein [Ralstonia pseudosolanacearum]APF85681.1 hypothetical protein BCR16_02145 [Ralstonia solanacearum FJAT-1458]AZU57891.1 hypothetical protein CFM90_17865 [Ralstonia solanacearum]ASL73690.1 hypothetical protein BC350_08645 [Ralstonia pseudosolanacearum]MCK4117792.1 hypothetical protein [Ralstonia pseudosolanacearum]NKB13397.1 hypothetical protein [Ralstonia solanacearum]